jgi:uncharacterized membrane protein
LELKSAEERSAIGATTGLLAGSLIGLIGGPIAVAMGATSGIVAGLLFDISSDEVNLEFVDEVAGALKKGKTAVIAEIDETWTVPVDSRLTDATVFRRLKHEVADDHLARESKAIATEYHKLEEELQDAGDKARKEIEAALEKLEAKASIVNDQLTKKLIDTKSELDAKLNAIEEQMKGVKEKRKVKMAKRLGELMTEYTARIDKLKRAAKLVNQAFGRKEELEKSNKEHLLA